MRYLNSTDTRQALPMVDAVKAMQHAFSGESEAPLRSSVGHSLVMPGRLDGIMAVKVVSTVPGNPAGIVAVFGPDGAPLGFVHGPTLTAIRTGAVCGLATAMLAPPEVSTMAMLGAGAMAVDQVSAIRAVRPIERVLVWSRNRSNARLVADIVRGEVAEDPDQAVGQVDVISCATPATSPLFSAASVTGVAHVNAVGAFTPEMVELPPELLHRAYVVVDDVDAAASEAGDLIQAGRIPDTNLRELLADKAPPIVDDVTVFKSVGIAAQDVAAAHAALLNAEHLGIGTLLPS
jgi:ornithine cyclodeaminase/alanine dehydrogenase-like protein (mu-crystallin family)